MRGAVGADSVRPRHAAIAKTATKQKPRRRAAVRKDGACAAPLRFATLVLFHVVADAEARAGGRVHLLRGVDRVLELGDAVFDLGELLLDLILQIADLLLRHLKCGLVELSLLISENRHSLPPKRTPERRGL